MSTYIIGDLQGCFTALQHLLEKVKFNPGQDQLWFVGDLVSRGPESLESLRFVRSLGDSAITVLGNHDISLIAAYYGIRKPHKSLQALVEAEDYSNLVHWLRHQPLFYHHPKHNTSLVHAGILPDWSLETAQHLAREVEQQLQQNDPSLWLAQIYGDEPNKWSKNLNAIERQRFSVNVFTRMRFLFSDGRLEFHEKRSPNTARQSNQELIPWFAYPRKAAFSSHVFFGHWSTLGFYNNTQFTSLDTGCVWDGALSAYCLDTKQLYSINCSKLWKKKPATHTTHRLPT